MKPVGSCKKVAIMQPYFFPYLGYFQLIGAVDVFVIYDDVNFINRGWINRNNISSDGRSQRITLALSNSSQNLLINQIAIVDTKTKLLKTIAQNYSKAPFFNTVYPMLEKIIRHDDENLGNYLSHSLQAICEALGIATKMLISSRLNKDCKLKGQEKVLAICVELEASHYLNPVGGRALYRQEPFAERGVRLSFLQERVISYRQFGQPFIPNLSIIDVLMFNDYEQCRKLLTEYDIS